jgi:hypothetical protein
VWTYEPPWPSPILKTTYIHRTMHLQFSSENHFLNYDLPFLSNENNCYHPRHIYRHWLDAKTKRTFDISYRSDDNTERQTDPKVIIPASTKSWMISNNSGFTQELTNLSWKEYSRAPTVRTEIKVIGPISDSAICIVLRIRNPNIGNVDVYITTSSVDVHAKHSISFTYIFLRHIIRVFCCCIFVSAPH